MVDNPDIRKSKIKARDLETEISNLQNESGYPYIILCHGDFHLFNIIQDVKEDVYIIDWVDAVSGCPEADICRTYLLYIQFCKRVLVRRSSPYEAKPRKAIEGRKPSTFARRIGSLRATS